MFNILVREQSRQEPFLAWRVGANFHLYCPVYKIPGHPKHHTPLSWVVGFSLISISRHNRGLGTNRIMSLCPSKKLKVSSYLCDFICLFSYWFVLVLSGCYNKMPQTGSLIKHRNLFLSVLSFGGWKSEIRVQHGHILVKANLQVIASWLLVISSHGRRHEGSMWSTFYNNINLIDEGSALMT